MLLAEGPKQEVNRHGQGKMGDLPFGWHPFLAGTYAAVQKADGGTVTSHCKGDRHGHNASPHAPPPRQPENGVLLRCGTPLLQGGDGGVYGHL